MSSELFGTDGLRGQVNEFPMQPETVVRLGLAAGHYFRNGQRRHSVLIGKDTRLSGYIFESGLTSGLCAAGMDVYLVGPMPTPAISFLTKNMRCDLGVVISASHNPFQDNGIKFFDQDGFKLSDATETKISEMVLSGGTVWDLPSPERVGKATRIEDSPGRYVVSLKNCLPRDLTLEGLKVVLDCAHGAAYRVAPLVFRELGAEVVKIGTEPDGQNINQDCGSLHTERVKEKVLETGADLGIALDGDGDRVILVDERGTIADGDQIMALCANDFMERDELPGRKLVATVMSNMALQVFMQEKGGELIRTPVGDRHVAERMRKERTILGGEQSGHLIFMDYSTTGDGILAALQVLKIMRLKELPFSEIARVLTPFPQAQVSVPVRSKPPLESAPELQEQLRKAEESLHPKGRVLLRYSGTELKARVMVEGENPDRVRSLADDLAQTVGRCLG
ncbi:MAG: phosphoglucosamine mutase [Desulfohalobiaceae bacterium]